MQTPNTRKPKTRRYSSFPCRTYPLGTPHPCGGDKKTSRFPRDQVDGRRVRAWNFVFAAFLPITAPQTDYLLARVANLEISMPCFGRKKNCAGHTTASHISINSLVCCLSRHSRQ